jgi:ELWxxDGT repeat protein
MLEHSRDPEPCTAEALEARRLLAATLLADLDARPASSDATYLATLPRGAALIHALDNQRRAGLWRTDGTAAGTVKLGDVEAATEEQYHGLLGDTLFFAGSTDPLGFELWKSDGTASGTALVKDLNPSTTWQTHSLPRFFVPVGDRVFFQADTDAGNRWELWVSDGTSAGTLRVPGPKPLENQAMAALDGRLYYVALGSDPYAPTELWSTDGTAAGTRRVFQIPAPGTLDDGVFALGAQLLFFGSHNGFNLYASDGTTAGTHVVTRLTETSGSAINAGVVGAHLFFQSSYPAPSQLWSTDGTAEETHVILASDVPYLSGSLGDLALFRSTFNDSDRIWRSDGTAAGTQLIATLMAPPNGDDRLATMVDVDGGVAYFRAYDPAHGSELWKTDGTAGGTELARDLEPGNTGSLPGPFGAVNGKLVFGARTLDVGRELRAVELSSGAAATILDAPGTISSNAAVLAASDTVAYLVGTDPVDPTGRQSLWISDGTSAGTRLVASNLSRISEAVLFGGRLYYVSRRILYSTDGTSIVQVSGTPSINGSYGVAYVAATSSDLYWSSTEPGGGGYYAYLNSVGGLHVRFDDPGPPIIVDRTYDSAPGLHVVRDAVWAHFWDYNTRRMGWYRNGVFVSYNWSMREAEPDRTPPLPPPDQITVNGVRYFAFDDGVHGDELWVEDAAGARLYQDINLGPDSSAPGDFRLVAGRVIFAALRPDVGREMWALVPAPAPESTLTRPSRAASTFATPFAGSFNDPDVIEAELSP